MRWQIKPADNDRVKGLQRALKCSPTLARILIQRGLEDVDLVRTFFTPDLQHLHDPYLMKDMSRAVKRIAHNIETKTPILIFGDYDVDGTTAASLLYCILTTLGARVRPYIPDRATEGYGLSQPGISAALDFGADLLITCDCGINAVAEVASARDQGVDIIITDHHMPDKTLPDAWAILNPKREDCTYPFKALCGAGVAFKLAQALLTHCSHSLNPLWDLLDLVSLGTAADMVPIIDENRILTYHGLRLMPQSSRPGIAALLSLAGLEDKIPSVGQLVFGLAPRINAAGRMGDANRTVRLLTTSDEAEARRLAKELDEENNRRRRIQQAVVDDALRQVNSEVDLTRERAVVLMQAGWHPGVVGIVASRIKDEFHRPAIIIALDADGLGKGSARSIPGLDLYQALTAVKDHLAGYGGHPMAAGLTVRQEDFPAFKQAFLNHVASILTEEDMEPTLTLDSEVVLQDIDSRFMSFLEKLGPYGPGNMRPKFQASGLEVVGNPKVMGHGDHIRFRVRQGRTVFAAVGFNLSHHYETLIKGLPIDLAFVVETNEWQGRTSIQFNVRDIHVTRNHSATRKL
ncbi:MAG: single-stranded-DNA-specific exonuclease RecJ [Fidelibacterota bacterium]